MLNVDRVTLHPSKRHPQTLAVTTAELSEKLRLITNSILSTIIINMGDTVTNNNTQSIADYLAQLLKDKKQLAAFPNVFLHMERLLDEGE